MDKLINKPLDINGKKFEFSIRDGSVGDVGVFKQIFVNADYSLSRWKQGKCVNRYYDYLVSVGCKPLIIDAGANIGASASYFLSWYPKAYCYAIEPEVSNCAMFRRNMKEFDRWHLFEGALASSRKKLRLKLGSDWGHRLSDDGSEEVECIDVPEVLNQSFGVGGVPFILKIDIEGGESDVFSRDVSWLDKFALMVIEPHDWMLPFSGSSRSFMNAISKFDFDVVMHGENIFFFNRKLLAPFVV